MFDYLFFDLDGTLTDPALGITNSFIYAYKYFGMEVPDYKTLCSYIGPPLLDTFKNSFGFSEENAKEGVQIHREYLLNMNLKIVMLVGIYLRVFHNMQKQCHQ